VAALEEEKSKNNVVQWFFYNDQPPVGKASSTYAHAKGIFAWDTTTNTGFWISHSYPQYPGSNRAEDYENGQSASCISLNNADDRDFIYNSLSAIKIYVYNGSITTNGTANTDRSQLMQKKVPGDVDLMFKKRDAKNIWEVMMHNHAYMGYVSTWWDSTIKEKKILPDLIMKNVIVKRKRLYNNKNTDQLTAYKITQDHSKFGWMRGRDNNGRYRLCNSGSNLSLSQNSRGAEMMCVVIQKKLYDTLSDSALSATINSRARLDDRFRFEYGTQWQRRRQEVETQVQMPKTSKRRGSYDEGQGDATKRSQTSFNKAVTKKAETTKATTTKWWEIVNKILSDYNQQASPSYKG